MSANDQVPKAARQSLKRRDFLRHAGWGSVGVASLIIGASRSRVLAHPPSPYPSWIPPSDKPPKRGGILTRASAWDPPVLDPRLTNSVGLFQIATLTYNRLLRYPFADEAKGSADLTLKGDLAESWEGSADFKTWTFKLRQGVKWHNVPPLNGRELVADDIKYCYEAYAQRGRAVVYLPGNRRHGNAGQIHHPHPVEDAQYDVSAECGGSRGGDLPARGVGGGRRSQKAHDRHGSLYLERARAQGQSGARRATRTISTKGIRTSTSTVSSRPPMRRRAWRPSVPGRAISWGCKAWPMWKRCARPTRRRSCKRSPRSWRRLA